MHSDIEIANSCKTLKITEIAKKIGVNEEYLELYGNDKAKINLGLINTLTKPEGKLILVSAITPTPLGEGKSTTTIGLVDALCSLNLKAIGTLREPSLGPVFGVKGGAAGGGYAQIVPMADINLHFTGDLHAITCANNLISACIDNHIYQGNELQINPKEVVWKRCLDLNDRALRNVIVGLGATSDGVCRQDQFNITVASEIMAVLCLAKDMNDLRKRLDRIIIGYNYDKKPITVKDLNITGSILVILKDAIKPNLVQTLENNPFIVHGGPFANIAHGCNSIIATKMALKLADYVVTEAGFGVDLGAEKFFDIKCQESNILPNVVVVVVTIKALKYHGKVKMANLAIENVDAVKLGILNLKKHLETIKLFGVPSVIALNRYHSDTLNEINCVIEWANANGYEIAVSEVYAKGSAGGVELAKKVIDSSLKPSSFKPIYNVYEDVLTKISKIATNVYGASSVQYSEEALKKIKQIEKSMKDFYICMAKTPLSITDNPKITGAPTNFNLTIKEIRISAGAKFIICLTGDIMTMPGLSIEPLALKIDLDEKNKIINLS